MANRMRTERKTTEAGAPQASQQEIAKVAYELFERRGRKAGHDVEDWLEAERIVSARRRGAS